MEKIELIKTFEKGHQKLIIEQDSIGYHVVYFEFGEPLCSVTSVYWFDALREFDNMVKQINKN